MRIDSSVNGASGYRPNTQSAVSDSITQNIQEQIQRLEERLQEIAANQDTPTEVKMEQQNAVNEQIAQLRQQLFERRRELQMEKMEVKSAQQPEIETDSEAVSMSGGQMQAFAQAGSAMTQIKAKDHVRTGLKGEAKKLGFEISLDEARGLDVTDKLTALSDIEFKIDNVTKDMAKDMSGAVDSFDHAAKQDEKAEQEEDGTLQSEGNEKQDAPQTGHIDALV